MTQINITFRTPSRASFQWFECHEALTTAELHELVIQCRGATAAFATELNHRPIHAKDLTVEDHLKTLERMANTINERRFPTVAEAAEDLKPMWKPRCRKNWMLDQYETLQECCGAQSKTNASRLAGHYLWLVSRIIGWAYALLILFTLTSAGLQRLHESQRTELFTHIFKHRKHLFCKLFQDEAKSYNFDDIRISISLHAVIRL